MLQLSKKREVQFHVAITIMPDPLAFPKEKENEIGQWAAAFQPEMFGRVPRYKIDAMFEEFKAIVLKTCRDHGILGIGE